MSIAEISAQLREALNAKDANALKNIMEQHSAPDVFAALQETSSGNAYEWAKNLGEITNLTGINPLANLRKHNETLQDGLANSIPPLEGVRLASDGTGKSDISQQLEQQANRFNDPSTSNKGRDV